MRRSRLSCVLLPLLFLDVLAVAQTIEDDPEPDAASSLADELGLEEGLDDELMLFESIPIVVTAARRSQKITQSSAAISIITSDDILYGGLVSVPEMLQFTPGLDILYSDRNNVALGVRGSNHQFADRTLTLIDGRNATSALFGGTDFFRLPIFPGDIERIEVVRGPGGAAWGANAFNGVVNIIQKKPKDVLGLYAYARVNEFGDTFNQFRWADQEGKWSWRISGGYDVRESSSDAISDADFDSDDYSRDWRVNTQVVHELSETTDLDLGAAFIHVSRGEPELGGYPPEGDPRDDEHITSVRLHGRVDHEFDGGRSAYLQWFTHIEDVDRPSLWTYRTYETDLEGQLDLPISDSNRLSVGGNFRWININADERRATDFLASAKTDEFWAGLFVIDTWELTEDFLVETQLRGDWYSETELDWSGRLSLIQALDEGKEHTVRVSVAKAFRAPSYGLRETATERVPLPSPPLPPDLFAVNLLQSDDLDNEQTYYFEAGYAVPIIRKLALNATGYYQIYDDLIGFRPRRDPLGLGRYFAETYNVGGGEGYGAELVLTYTAETFMVSAWYAFNYFDTENSNQSIRAFEPARNKAGVSARAFLPYGITANLNYKYVDETNNDPGLSFFFDSVSDWHRLDLSLSKKLVEDKLEVTIGVRDVFDDTDKRVAAVGAFSAHKTPGRTVFGQLQLKF